MTFRKQPYVFAVLKLIQANGAFRGGKKIRVHGYLWIKSVMGTERVVKRVFAGNYPLLYGHGYGFDDTRAL